MSDQVEFSDRELELLRLLKDGASRGTAARRMGVSIHTVDFHMQQIAQRLPGRAPAMRRILLYLLTYDISQ